MTRIISGQGKGRRLQSPKGDLTRPTGARVKQTLFDILAPRLPGCRFLDAFAGGGAVGLEALSRGASRVVLIDSSGEAVRAIRANVEALGGGGDVQVFRQDARVAVPALGAAGHHFDVAFLDPPYESDLYRPLLEALGAGILDPEGVAVAEHFHKKELPEKIGGLSCTRSVRIGDHRLSFYRSHSEEGALP